MDLEPLRTFLEVGRTLHFGRAAEALHLTQAAVSARLALGYPRELGGAAYLPLPMVASALRRGRLHRVSGAPHFTRRVFAVYQVRSANEALIESVLKHLHPIAGSRGIGVRG